MKKLNYLLVLLVAGTVLSCVKDEGNYDYNEINDVSISNIDPAYTVVMLDSLYIRPDISRSLRQDESDLDYFWIAYNPLTTYFEADTLSRERDLDIVVNLVPGSYKISYHVQDRSTEVSYRQEFDITVISEFQRGLLVLSDVNGSANIAFISVTGDIYEDMYERINEGESAGTNPVAIRYTYRAPLDYVAVLCDDERGGVVLSSGSFRKMFDYQDYFYDPLTTIKPQTLGIIETYGLVSDYQVFGGRAFLVNNGKLHMLDPNYNLNVDGETIAVESKFYSAMPGNYLISEVICPATASRDMFFDKTGQRMLYIANYNAPTLLVVNEDTSGPFNPADVGLDMLWVEPTVSPRGQFHFNSIFEDDAGNRFYLQFNLTGSGNVVPMRKVPIAPDFQLTNAEAFTGNTLQDYIYFSVGSKVFVYDCVLNQEREVYDFGPGKVVDHIRWHEARLTVRHMHVAVRDVGSTGKSSSIYEMDVTPAGDMTIENVFENIAGRVVDMHWKN